MSVIHIEIDGKKVAAVKGQTIYEVARNNDIEIPTLCHDDRLKPYGSCWVCLVEVDGARGFVPSCAYEIRDGLKVKTNTEAVRKARKIALELLLSNHLGDCVAPCQTQCPAHVDVQGFVALIAEGNYRAATKLHKEKNPFPLVCGRVCPRTCETKCRRGILDEPVAIAYLKRFFADNNINCEHEYFPIAGKPTGKQIAIVGAGPAGLSAAYYLAEKGHSCTVYEMHKKAGGMLRYGIPSYRLPRNILEKEISYIEHMGVKILTQKKMGTDFTLAELQKDYDAVLLAIGAHQGTDMGCKGEHVNGVVNGIEFLAQVSDDESISLSGKKVGVVGGGNTAIDAARTALRLGASEVTLIYRRTEQEMPAWQIEVDAAREEGVKMLFLAAPAEVIAENGTAHSLRCIKMALGEPDASGRRRPVPVEGSEFDIALDLIIPAIGQKPDISCFDKDSVELTRWQTIAADEKTGATKQKGIFTAGDSLTGAATAVEAIAGGRNAALSIDQYLNNIPIIPQKEFQIIKDSFKTITADDFAHIEKKERIKMPELHAHERIHSFVEVETGLDAKTAEQEASRCLSCGCNDVFECKLKKYAVDYQAHAEEFLGSVTEHPIDSRHPFIERDANKCILCARCIRTCMEIRGIGALGFVYRGFKAEVSPAMQKPLSETACDSCGQCISACPTGALAPKSATKKPGPWKPESFESYCTRCSLLCPVTIHETSGMISAIHAEVGIYNKNICKKGSFAALDIPAESMSSSELKTLIYDGKISGIIAGNGVSAEEMYALQQVSDTYLKKPVYITHSVSPSSPLPADVPPTVFLCADINAQHMFPILNPWLRSATLKGARIALAGTCGPVDSFEPSSEYTADVEHSVIQQILNPAEEWKEFFNTNPLVIIAGFKNPESILQALHGKFSQITVLNPCGFTTSEHIEELTDNTLIELRKSGRILFYGECSIAPHNNDIAVTAYNTDFGGNICRIEPYYRNGGTFITADGRHVILSHSKSNLDFIASLTDNPAETIKNALHSVMAHGK